MSVSPVLDVRSVDDRTGRYRYYVLSVLFLAHTLSMLDSIVLGVLIEPIKRDLRLSDSQAGLITGLGFVLLYSLLGIPIARWADRSNRRNILGAGMLVWSCMTALSAFATDATTLGLARVGVGIGEATCFPCAISLIADYFPKSERSRAVAIFQSSIYVGVVGGTVVASYIANLAGWRVAMLSVGLPGVILGGLLVLTVREPLRGTHDSPAESAPELSSLWPTLKAILGRNFILLWLGVAVVGMSNGIFSAWAPAFLQRAFGVSVAQAGAAVGPIAGLGGVIGTISGGALAAYLSRRAGHERFGLLVPAICAFAAVPFVIAFARATGLWGAVIALGLGNWLISAHQAPCVATSLNLVPARSRGLAAAILLLGQLIIGSGIGPLAVGMLSDALAPRYGADSLRHALLFAPLALVAGSALFLIAFKSWREAGTVQ